ncbi:protein kinase domain-containing protein [Nocardiopsis algeriensis]|uniref:serine/threonine-protein kinase n=1 Tax=Nocardiopsis algeriensis TaxID=1478215 RepID=UPI003B42E863
MSSNSDEQTVANRYVLRRELGRGGMGVVWEAFDPSLDRVVAIKQVLLPDHFTDSERADAHARVRREAQSAARISHPAVITIHDVFEFEGDPWVVMELVEGGSLQDMLSRRGALDPDTVADIAESLLQAVKAADEAGVLHRDIKPGNIMMSTDGRVILTDFGIATMEGGPSITRTGALIGSPEYMPPERLEGGPAEHRGDLWSIGVTLFSAVEGLSPFRRESITAAIAAVLSSPLPPMRRAGWLAPVITGLLERDPDRRLTVDQALTLLSELRPGTGTGPHAAGAVGAGAGGPQPPSGAPSGGYPAPGPGATSGPLGHTGQFGGPGPTSGPLGGHRAPSGGHPVPGPTGGPVPVHGGPSGPTTPPRPFPPGSGPSPYAMHSGAGPAALPSPVPPPGRSGGAGANRVLLGVGGAALAVLVIAVAAVGGVLWSRSPETEDLGTDRPAAALPESGAPVEPAPSHVPSSDDDDDEGPPSYDSLTTYESRWFDVDHPEGWEVDESQIDSGLAVFVAPGGDHQVWVAGWTEEEFTGTSYEYLEETKGGTDVEGDVTSSYFQLDLTEFTEGFYEDGWDVALVEAKLTNDTWPTPERRFWAYAINMDYEGDRVFYMVSVNVPRGDATYYDDLPAEVMDSFDPHL